MKLLLRRTLVQLVLHEQKTVNFRFNNFCKMISCIQFLIV